jgi:hypothetical protein
LRSKEKQLLAFRKRFIEKPYPVSSYIVAAGAATANSLAGFVKTLLEIKQLLQAQGKADQARLSTPTGETCTFAEMDDAFLHQLLGIDE